MKIALLKNDSFLSKVIRLFLGGWSHIVIFIDKETIIHADRGMVVVDNFDKYLLSLKNPTYKLMALKAEYYLDYNETKKELLSFTGKKYDYLNAVMRIFYKLGYYFGLKRTGKSLFDNNSKLFCTEPLAKILSKNGYSVRPNIHYTQLTPSDYFADDSIFEEIKC